MLLDQTHIDVLQGPEAGNLLYIGKAEERRLGLSSFKEQLKTLAGEIQNGTKPQPSAPKKSKKSPGQYDTQVSVNGKVRSVRFEVGQQPVYKRKLRLGGADDICGALPGSIKADGFAFAGDRNWKAQQKTPYVMDQMVEGLYVTTAAVVGQDLKLAKEPPPHPVKTYDLSPEMSKWLGDKAGSYTCEVQLDVRIGPDGNRDTVERLTNLRQVTAKVVESEVSAVIVGRQLIEFLTERKYEGLEFNPNQVDEREAIEQRLQDVVDAAKLQGMSPEGIAEGVHMIQEEFQSMWRLTLGPDDYADVPPMEIKLKDPEQRLPKPYSKRHTKRELEWWRNHIDALLAAHVMQKASTKDLSPANLVDKFKDGVVMLDDHRMVLDLRERNANAETRHYHLPRLDDLWHHLVGAKCFGSADATKGYLQAVFVGGPVPEVCGVPDPIWGI